MDTTGHPAPTPSVQRLINRAAALGLRPRVEETTHRGSYRVMLNGQGVDSGFGTIVVGARTGQVLHGCLTHGNHGPSYRHTGYRGARTMLIEYASYLLCRGALSLAAARRIERGRALGRDHRPGSAVDHTALGAGRDA